MKRGSVVCTSGLMGDLSEECRDLSLAGVQGAFSAELGEASGGADEGGVVVEPLRGAGTVVLVEEDGVVELLGDNRRDVAAVRALAARQRRRTKEEERGGEEEEEAWEEVGGAERCHCSSR